MFEIRIATGKAKDAGACGACGPVYIDLIGTLATSGEHLLEPVDPGVKAFQPGTVSYCQVPSTCTPQHNSEAQETSAYHKV